MRTFGWRQEDSRGGGDGLRAVRGPHPLQAGYNLNVAKPLESREIVAVIAALVVSIPPQ